MAIVIAINEKTQSRAAMKKVMDYVVQDSKTAFYNEQGDKLNLISGQNCCGDTAFQEFMSTKKQYRKESKVFFYQYVQSFKPDCGATPQDIHQMGVELAQRFEGYEVLIATHIDRDHWHNHLVVNSVSCDTGLKLQFNEKDLEQLRTLSDKICAAHGLEVLKPYQKPDMKPMGAGEYRAAVRGNSYKFQLMNAIDKAMTQSRTKGEFTACMEQMGYGVKWIPHYQNITYTTPKGKRCRDDKLHTRRYLKEMMEREFELRRTQTEEQQLAARERIAGAGSTATKLLSTADRKLGRDTAANPLHATAATQPQGAERSTTHPTEPTAEQGRFTGDTASGQGNGADIITGWEAEREILFHPEMALAEGAAQPNVAIAVPDIGGIVGNMVQLGKAIERLDNTVPVSDAAMKSQHSDRKNKKLGIGQKEDDHSGYDFEMSM